VNRSRCAVIAAAALLLLAGCGDASLRSGALGAESTQAPSSTVTDPPQTAGAEPDTTAIPADEPEPVDSLPPDTTLAAADSVTTAVAPTTARSGPMEPVAADCPDTERGAVVYRPIQRGMLCENGAIAYVFPVTTGRIVPEPGEFVVSSRNTFVRSTVGGHISTMTNFVAFTKESPRIAFHSVPKTLDGKWVQPLSSVGSIKKWGASSGCIRVLPDDSKRIWNFLQNGDKVRIID
jgi:hypothetical protein